MPSRPIHMLPIPFTHMGRLARRAARSHAAGKPRIMCLYGWHAEPPVHMLLAGRGQAARLKPGRGRAARLEESWEHKSVGTVVLAGIPYIGDRGQYALRWQHICGV